jgi:hypothetical protein
MDRVLGRLARVCALPLALLAVDCKDSGSGGGAGGGPGDDGSGACTLGYARESGACVWRGGPLDPGFQNTPVAWVPSGGATIETWVPGVIDPGVARFDPTVCQPRGGVEAVSQTFPMPAFADAEVFAMELVNGGGLNPTVANMSLGPIPIGPNPSKSRICLGERFYGGDITLRFLADCSAGVSGDLDHVSIVPAPECPAPGIVPGGDFETSAAWDFSAPAEILAGAGTGGSHAGHLPGCGPALANAHVSMPWHTIDRPALTLASKGTVGATMQIYMASPTYRVPVLGAVSGTGAFATTRFCIPEWGKGLVAPLHFVVAKSANLCPTAADFIFDDVAIVSDPTCPSSTYLLDGDFESTDLASPWTFDRNDTVSGIAAIASVSDAHSGQRILSVSSAHSCDYTFASQSITVPPPVGNAGPALKFWYRLPAAVNALFYVDSGAPGPPQLPVTPQWTQRVQCLDPNRVNQAVPIQVTAQGGLGQTCMMSFPAEQIDVDDVEVTTDASCPTQ